MTNFTCAGCGVEAERHRRGRCARCTLRDDLAAIMVTSHANPPSKVRALIDVLCAVDRPQSIHVWKRNPEVIDILARLGDGSTAFTHDAFDALPAGRPREHIRQLLEHHELLPHRDDDLARFESWLARRLEETTDARTRHLVERFATWHHVRRIRARSREGLSTHGSVHTAKQELTETGRFLDFLAARGQTLESCTKADIDEWLTSGPTTRTIIRTFIVWARKQRLCDKSLDIAHRSARSTPLMTQNDRLTLVRQCLTGDDESVAYRLAGALLLLYAQPITRICQLRTTDIVVSPTAIFLQLGDKPAILPEPFAELVRTHLQNRPNMRTGNTPASPWLFPSRRPGAHLHANTIMIRLRAAGLDLLGSRNAALRDLVRHVPAPLLAEQLGYSQQVTHLHAARAAETMARYGSARARDARL